MKAARLVVLVIALGAGGVAAMLAGRSDKPAEVKPVAVKSETVDILVAKADIGMGTPLTANELDWQAWPASTASGNFIRKSDRPNAIQDLAGGLGGDVAWGDARPPDRDDQVDPADHGGVQRVADLDFVSGDRDDTVDDESRLGQQFGYQRTAMVLVPVSGAIVDHHDQSPANYQFRTRFHGCNRISELRQSRRRGLVHSHY